ncbi:MAG: rhomboid family intramembrane serine protease [Myxococcota bacterium]
MQKSQLPGAPRRSIPPGLRGLMPAETSAKTPAKGDSDKTTLKQGAMVLAVSLAVMWGMEILDLVLPIDFDQWGIRPRTFGGLFGILLAPILHGGFGHLLANTLPFFILGFLVMLRGGVRQWTIVTAFTTIVGGLGVWLVAGSNTVTIGASGVIFGYFGYLMARAIFERSLGAIIIAGGVGFLYGGLIWGVLPGMPGVSWQGHLFGALSGALWAYLSRPAKKAAAA